MSVEDQQLTIVGTMGGEPDLRFTPSGAAVCNFSVAVNHRYFNRNSGQWEEKGTDWWRCNAWRGMAENISESFRKGDRVIVVGTVASRTWDGKNGEKITSWELTVLEAGPSTKWATTRQIKADRQQAGQNQQGGQSQGQYNRPQQNDDPWAQPAQASRPSQNEDPWSQPPTSGDTRTGGFADEPPF